MNIFLDTNVWLRYFIGDNPKQLETVSEILQRNNSGEIRICTSTFVLSEFTYVEISFYHISKASVVEDLEAVRTVRNIWILEETNFEESLRLFKKSSYKNHKWSDCVIVSQVPEDYKLCSFDERLEKLIGKKRFISPADVVN